MVFEPTWKGMYQSRGSIVDRAICFMLLPSVDAERHGCDSAVVSSAAKMCEGYRPLPRGTHMTMLCNRTIPKFKQVGAKNDEPQLTFSSHLASGKASVLKY